MQTENFSQPDQSYGSLVKELITSAKDLVSNEITLAKEEMKIAVGRIATHSARAAMFGALLALSALPFLAFLVIGLGNILGGNYWLSSLIVALVCAGVGGTLAYREYQKIKEADIDLPRTRKTLEMEKNVIHQQFDNVRESTQRRVV